MGITITPTSDQNLVTTDVTTNDVSTTKHGFVPKVTDITKFLKGDGTWAAAGSASDTRIATVIVASDGSGDFTDIQDGIDDLPAGGGLVFIKEGTYTISASLTIVKSNITLQGSGASTVIKAANNLDANIFEIGDTANPYKQIILRDFKIDGNKANMASGIGINVQALCANCSFLNLYIYQTKTKGLNFATDCHYFLVQGCTFEECAGSAICVVSCEAGIIKANYFIKNARSATYQLYLYYGYRLIIQGNQFADDYTAQSVSCIFNYESSQTNIVGNVFERVKTALHSAGMYNNFDLNFSDNQIWYTYSHAIDFLGQTATFSNNRLRSVSGYGINELGAYNLIENNSFLVISLAGIKELNHYCIIKGNVFGSTGHEAIKSTFATNCVIEGNVFSDCCNSVTNVYGTINLAGGGSSGGIYHLVSNNMIFGQNSPLKRPAYAIWESDQYANLNFYLGNKISNYIQSPLKLVGTLSNASNNTWT